MGYHWCQPNTIAIITLNVDEDFSLNARIFFDAHECSVSVALDTIQHFTFYSRSLDFMIPLTAKLPKT